MVLIAMSDACRGALPLRVLQGWEDAVKNWQEIPKGVSVKKIWYNHAVRAQRPDEANCGLCLLSAGGMCAPWT